jgi:RNA polymerase sigma factor (sigma-70 family)
VSAKPAKREYKPPKQRSLERPTSPAERMRKRPDALRAIGAFYSGITKPTNAENKHLAQTDRTELARRNVPLVVFVVTHLLRMPSAKRNRERPHFMMAGGTRIGFGREHRRKVDDIIQDGVIGLLRACATFDPDRGTLSTHAVPHIISAIQIGDSRQTAVHIPVDVQRQVRTDPELLSESQRSAAQNVLSGYADLDAPFGALTSEGDRDTLADYLEAPQPDQGDEMTARIALEALEPLERKVIEHLYGIVGAPLDLQATGTTLGLTRREVREIERRAMKKMQAATVIHSAHDICSTRLCQAANCENDAENGWALCARCEHRRQRGYNIELHDAPPRPPDRVKKKPPRAELSADQQEHIRALDRARRDRERERKQANT